MDAVCDFLVDLVRAFIRDDPSLLCLHCGAIQAKDGLIVFPSDYAAGKSTLAMHAAARGARLFADDVMPLRQGDNSGVAVGILPRLRLPLPQETHGALSSFLEQRKSVSSSRFCYYAMRGRELAAYGETVPIAGMVLLERKEGAAPALEEVGAAEMLKKTILRNFSQNVPGIAVLERLHDLVGKVRRFRLTYAMAEPAVALLAATFPFQTGESR